MNIEIIADNAGGITLQNEFGDYVFYYDGRDGFKQLAKDIFELFSDSESIKSFDGNNPLYYISDEYFEKEAGTFLGELPGFDEFNNSQVRREFYAK